MIEFANGYQNVLRKEKKDKENDFLMFNCLIKKFRLCKNFMLCLFSKNTKGKYFSLCLVV